MSSDTSNIIYISSKRPPFLIKLAFLFIIGICFLIPLGVATFVFIYGIEPHVGYFLSFIIFWGSGYYLLRIFLWNFYGQEIISLKKNSINYIADYKYFKDNKQEISSTKNLHIVILTDEESMGRLLISNDKEKIETVVRTSKKRIKEIDNIIVSKYYN